MTTPKRKEEVITFKVDKRLSHALAGIENRSAFILDAILAALGNTCPVCRGTQNGRLQLVATTPIAGEPGDTYPDFLRYNVEQILNALGE